MSEFRHAYLIMAHHEFEVLQKLIDALDDERNAIYVHIDRKVKNLPVLHSLRARLVVIKSRVNVRWGHVSQIASEYALFEAAYHSGESYSRYHLISGTHMPLKNQNEIHAFFDNVKNKEILNYLYTDAYEANFKINHFHFFLRNYKSKRVIIEQMAQLLWHILLKIQYKLGIKKAKPDVRTKANNWVSLTGQAVAYILQQRIQVLRLFRYSFCGDEFFVPYLLENSSVRFHLVDEKRLLFNEFIGSVPRTITDKDFDFLMTSHYLFARKFCIAELTVVDRILNHIKMTVNN